MIERWVKRTKTRAGKEFIRLLEKLDQIAWKS